MKAAVWSDGTPVAGQQFEYAFDDIGNRQSTKEGGDQWGVNLRSASYSANNLNQYTSRTVPGYFNDIGSAKSNAAVTLWSADGSYASTYRRGDYFCAELPINNSTGALWLTLTNLAVLQNGTNTDILTNEVGNAFVPATPESFTYDADGNLTSGYCVALNWICDEPLSRLCGGRGEAERKAALREYTEQAVRQGTIEPPWERLVAGVVLGSEEFARQLRRGLRANRREQPQLKAMARPVEWSRIISALEEAKGERWADFGGRHGDWGRDAALWLGRRQGRLKLAELGDMVGGMDYAAVGQAVSRFGKRLAKDTKLRGEIRRLETQLSNVEM
jgi:hypothetical protein